MSILRKKVLANKSSGRGLPAVPVCYSLYPFHRDLIANREAELNIHRSVLVQTLIEIEAEQGLLRPEVKRRILLAGKQQQQQQLERKPKS